MKKVKNNNDLFDKEFSFLRLAAIMAKFNIKINFSIYYIARKWKDSPGNNSMFETYTTIAETLKNAGIAL